MYLFLKPTFNEETAAYFVKPELHQPWEQIYTGDKYERQGHASNYFNLTSVVDLQKVIYDQSPSIDESIEIDWSRVQVSGLLIQATLGDKTETLELTGIAGLSGTRFMSAIDESSLRIVNLSFRNLSAKLLKRRDGYRPTIFGEPDGVSVHLSLSGTLGPNSKTVNIKDQSARVSHRGTTVYPDMEIIGYTLEIPFHDLDRTRR